MVDTDLFPCKYLVVRFFPGLDRDEFINVGTILHVQDDEGRIEGRFLQRYANLKFFVPKRERQILAGLKAVLKDLELGLESASDDPSYLDRLSARFQHHLQFSEVRQALADDPLLKVEDLFDLFVSVETRERETRTQVSRKQLQAQFRAAFRQRQIPVETGDEAIIAGTRLRRHQFDFVLPSVVTAKCLQTISFDITNVELAIENVTSMRGSIDDIRDAAPGTVFWAAIMPPSQGGAIWESAAAFLSDAGCEVRNLRSTTAINVVDEFGS